MKRLAWVVIACCGGGSAKPKSPTADACMEMASHVHEITRTKGNTDNAELLALAAESAEVNQRVYGERCAADKWSADSIDCHNKLTKDDSAMNVCGEKLTEAQRVALETRLGEEFGKKRQQP